MATLNIEDINDAIIEFPARQVSFPDAIWIDNNFYKTNIDNPYKEFSKTFSYIAVDDQDKCFSRIPSVSESEVIFQAERYGGQGVGTNGGGSRCANYRGVQIKGIGRNPLVGSRSKFYSYGGLNARDAVYETIYAAVLDKLLPIGVAKIHGLIFTCEDGAYNEYDENDPSKEELGWGALLVRDACVRPGHFLPNQFFKEKEAKIRLSPDTIRTKRANQSFFTKAEDMNGIVNYLKNFLTNCANQFSYTKVHRITHGGIYPSNIVFDGRWIDLSNVSFITGGENTGGCPPFYEEANAIVGIVREFLATFSKYNRVKIDTEGLINFYNHQLSGFFEKHAVSLFSISHDHLNESCRKDALAHLSNQVSVVLHSGKQLILRWPETINELDPVLRLQEGLFVSLTHENTGREILSSLKPIKGFDVNIAISAFGRIVHHIFYRNKKTDMLFFNFVTLIAISSLKKSLFAEFFYKGRLGKYINKLIYADPFSANSLIHDAISLSDWTFESPENGVAQLYVGSAVVIGFEALEGAFFLQNLPAEEPRKFRHVSELRDAISHLSDDQLSIQGFNFRNNILKILSTIEVLRK